MQFSKMPYTRGGSHKVVEVHNRHSSFHLSLIHTCYFQIWLIHKGCAQETYFVRLGSQPWLDEQHATRVQMTSHRLQRLPQTRQSFRITYRTEQTQDHVERVPEIEVHHIRVVKDDPRIAPPGDSQHLFIEIEPFDRIISPQESKVRPGPTCHVQQSIAPRSFVVLDHRVDLLGFLSVILHRAVNRVVIGFGLCIHSNLSTTPCFSSQQPP